MLSKNLAREEAKEMMEVQCGPVQEGNGSQIAIRLILQACHSSAKGL